MAATQSTEIDLDQVKLQHVEAKPAAKSPEDVKAMLAFLQVKYQLETDKMSSEEKQKHYDMIRQMIFGLRSMESDLSKSMEESDQNAVVVQMCGCFPRTAAGIPLIPGKDEIQAAFGVRKYQRETIHEVEVKSIKVEYNFKYIGDNPSNPNYLLKEPEVFVTVASVKQANYIISLKHAHVSIKTEHGSTGQSFRFSSPLKDADTRATYREIGSLIIRLKQVDERLKALGAVAGRGGVPELSDMLIQNEDFDTCIETYHKNKEANGRQRQDPLMAKQHLHAFLCTRTRVDRRARQAALEPLVDERIEILLKLVKYDQDRFPFAIEREFK